MPQKLRQKDVTILTHSSINPKHFNHEALALAYCIVLQHSNIESTQLNVWLNLMGGKESDLSKVYLEQTSLTQKNKTIDKISRMKLNPQAFDGLCDLRKRTDPIRKFRDKLAHWQAYQVANNQKSIPSPTEDLKLFDPSQGGKSSKIDGYYSFSKNELNTTLNDANRLGNEWIHWEIKLKEMPEKLLK